MNPRELSHIIKSRCACVWMYMVDICMVVNLILLCSLKTYLSFDLEIFFQENKGYLIHLYFLGGHLSTHCLRYLGHLFIFSQLFFSFLSLFLNNFCIAPCLFSTTKLWEIATRIWSIYLVDGKPIKHVFVCHTRF